MRTLYGMVSETQVLSVLKVSDWVSQNCRISRFPTALRPPAVKVASGAHRLIISSMSFLDVALWKFFSSRSISQRSAFRCRACSEAPLPLEPPQAASATMSIPTAHATATAPPMESIRMLMSLLPGPFARYVTMITCHGGSV
jgi:hypothetical protein